MHPLSILYFAVIPQPITSEKFDSPRQPRAVGCGANRSRSHSGPRRPPPTREVLNALRGTPQSHDAARVAICSVVKASIFESNANPHPNPIPSADLYTEALAVRVGGQQWRNSIRVCAKQAKCRSVPCAQCSSGGDVQADRSGHEPPYAEGDPSQRATISMRKPA